MNTVFIELGGNMGNRLQLITDAKILLQKLSCKIINQSSVYETPPWGFTTKLNFYNQIVKIETTLQYRVLLSELQKIENTLGRVRGDQKYASRTMDADILFFNNEIIDEEYLTIPHPRLHLRKFVLVPLNEIIPNFIHPVLKISIHKLLENCPDRSKCLKVIK